MLCFVYNIFAFDIFPQKWVYFESCNRLCFVSYMYIASLFSVDTSEWIEALGLFGDKTEILGILRNETYQVTCEF